jgi:hypothetical protein
MARLTIPDQASWGLALCLVVAHAIVGCHSASLPDPAPSPEPTVDLQVQNHHWRDLTLYAIHDGQRSRIGTVTAVSTAVFTLPAHLLAANGEMRFVADAIGSQDTVTTERLIVRPGQRVGWTLESDLARSSVAIW